jgi:hypothetical protein
MIATVTEAASVFCLGAPFILAASIAARADMVTEWNQTALRASDIADDPVPVQTQAMAMEFAPKKKCGQRPIKRPAATA